MRHFIKWFAVGKIIKRHLPSHFNSRPLYVSPDSQLKYLKISQSAFDKELLDVACNYINKSSIVWDVGANVGVFSIAAAHIATNGSVVAIEADVWLTELMKKSLSLKANQDLQLKILPTAIADQCKVSEFYISGKGRANNSLLQIQHEATIMEKTLVPTLTLDTLLEFFSKPNFIKIDVEGAEELVLRGGIKILEEVRPVIYIEVCKTLKTTVTEIFKTKNYVLFSKNKIPIEFCTFNTFAIPQEKL